MHLAQSEVVELEAEFGGDVGVGHLFGGQRDIQANRFGTDIERAAVGGLHDSRAAAGDNHIIAPPVQLAGGGDEAGEFASRIVVVALGEDPFSPLELALVGGVVGVVGSRPAGRC